MEKVGEIMGFSPDMGESLPFEITNKKP